MKEFLMKTHVSLPTFLAVALLTLLPLAGNALAAEELAPGYDSCMEKALSNADMMHCTTAAHTYWDATLNRNYAAALNRCNNAASNADKTACKDKLRKTQRLWIQYKEAMTDVLLTLEGGTLARLTASGFLAEETKKQALLLHIGAEE